MSFYRVSVEQKKFRIVNHTKNIHEEYTETSGTYKNRGGRVTVGTDAAFIYNLYGFDYPTEMSLLREAGFHPLEIIKAATLNGAESLGMAKDIGSVEVGKLADFVITEENPLTNLQTLYGIGAIKLTEDNKVVRVGGVKYTIKDGIIYDAKQLLADVRKMVADEKAKTDYKIIQPGIKGAKDSKP